MSLLQNYSRYPITAYAGEGCYLTDVEGNRYLDVIAGIGVNALGYSHPRITAALADQAALCVHTSNLIHHRYQEPLAERLCAMSGLDRVFFSNSGTEAMEAALKAARARHKGRFVALKGSFHGRTFGSLSITGQCELRRNFGPFAAPVAFIDPCEDVVIGDDVSAVILEPVLGEGGIHPLPEEWLRRMRIVTERAGALLIVDETQCGLGRTGKYFAYQWAGIRPDIVVTAKPLGGGLPLGATMFTGHAASFLPVHSHGSTFGGGPLACRVALEFLGAMDELLPQIRERGEELRIALEGLRERHPAIGEIRSKGMMFGIQLRVPGEPIVLAALERGLLLNCTRQTVLRLLPPYILTSDQVREAAGILHHALCAVHN